MPASILQLSDGFDSPVGSAVERAGNHIWPGKWFDFTGFNVLYTVRKEPIPDTNQLRDVKAFHTGADLNLPKNKDKLAPLYAAGSGEVIFADEKPVWGKIIVIRHDPLAPDADPVYTRYAHMERVDVTAGEEVTRGQQIGLIGEGDPDTPFSAHLHFDVCITNILEQNPGHWPALQQHLVTRHYTNPKAFIEANRPRK
jgi:murein DD-endopeptidase MepM/ murein hydrolase activator NlpD